MKKKMNYNVFSNKNNFKKIGMAIIVLLVIGTVLYNLNFQSVTKYKAQQQSMADEYNSNSEIQSNQVIINTETTENGSEEVNKDNIISQSDTSIIENLENPSTNKSSIENTTFNDALNSSTVTDNLANNAGVISTQGSSITSGENNSSSCEIVDVTCYIEIRCDAISRNMIKWTNIKKNSLEIVPPSGVIVANVEIKITDKSTVFDVLKKVTTMNNISLDASLGYIKSIKQLEQMDAGSGSGWLYWVNNVSPSVTCSSYIVKNGDKIKWQYTCDYGNEFDKNGNLK